MSTPYSRDSNIPVKRLQLDSTTNQLLPRIKKQPFIRGPILVPWLSRAAHLPGKAVNVAIALCWLQGMSSGKPFKLTRRALAVMNVSRDAASDGLRHLEELRLVEVTRSPGRLHVVQIKTDNLETGITTE
jgi:hypothetical protein